MRVCVCVCVLYLTLGKMHIFVWQGNFEYTRKKWQCLTSELVKLKFYDLVGHSRILIRLRKKNNVKQNVECSRDNFHAVISDFLCPIASI